MVYELQSKNKPSFSNCIFKIYKAEMFVYKLKEFLNNFAKLAGCKTT